MQLAVITVVRGRHEHLLRQLDGLRRSDVQPSMHVVVAMGDPAIRPLMASDGAAVGTIIELDVAAGAELPLAAARNAGADRAMRAGAELLVFLDVDCIPGTRLLTRYADAAADPAHADALLCGPVAYLPPDAQGQPSDRLPELASPHPARPDPADGAVIDAIDRRLFWSLSFAVRAPSWERIGGFSTDYTGYGGEDTDFAELAYAAGIAMRWVGGAIAYHQYHPVSVPPVEHAAAIVRNARVFYRRWGWWPMSGWLEAFAERGIARFDPAVGWELCAPAGGARPVV